MRKIKKLLAMATATLMIGGLFVGCGGKDGGSTASGDPVKVGVFLYKFDDTYISTVRQSLQEIQKENEGKVEFEFIDGKGGPSQYKTIL